MTADQWEQIQTIFVQALSRPLPERADFLDTACPEEDPALRREVEALLDEAERPGPIDALASELVGPLTARWRGVPTADDRVGPYRIIREIGRGGMGVVYLAERADGQYEHRVALKVMREHTADADRLARFLHERQILAQLTHPNIAQLLDGGVTDTGAPFFVMEYVAGQPIHAYCDEHALPIEARLELVEAVGAAVQHAHQALIIHRDLKPSNILAFEPGAADTGHGTVKLLDFGIAKLLETLPNEAPRTQAGRALMTPEYAAPEQVRGEAVTTATDVYALGVLLYKLLTGRRPYRLDGASPAAIERIVSETEPLPPSEAARTPVDGAKPAEAVDRAAARATTPDRLARRLAGDLDTIILKALQKEPSRRYASVEALLDDLRRYRDGQPVQARPDTLGYRTKKFIRRNRASVMAAALVVVSLVGGLTAALWQARIAAAERDQAQLEAAKAEQVTAFFVDLFGAADPSEAQGDTLNAFEVVDRGAAQIEQDLPDQPEVRAAVKASIGQVYQNMGDYERAQPLLEDALDLRRAALGPQHPEVAHSLNDLGVILHYRGEFEAAEARYREALQMRRQGLDAPHEGIASTLNNLGAVLHHQGSLDSAETYYRDALAMRQLLVADDDPELAVNIANVAMIRKYKGDYATADSLLREALAIQRAALGHEHPSVASTLNNIGTTRLEMGDEQGAIDALQEALAIRRTVLGAEHPLVAQSLNNLAAAYERIDRLNQAERLYREALALRRRLFGNEHPALTSTLNNLALVLRTRGELDAAEPLLRESLALRRTFYGDDHPRVARALSNLARLHSDRGAHETALPLYREALRIRQQALPGGHEAIAGDQTRLGVSLTALGRYAEAEPHLLQAHAALTDARGADHAHTQYIGQRLVDLYEAWGRPDKAGAFRTPLEEGTVPDAVQ